MAGGAPPPGAGAVDPPDGALPEPEADPVVAAAPGGRLAGSEALGSEPCLDWAFGMSELFGVVPLLRWASCMAAAKMKTIAKACAMRGRVRFRSR